MNERHKLTIRLLMLIDIAVVSLAYLLAAAITTRAKQVGSLVQFLSLRTRVGNFAIFVLALCVCHAIFHFSGLYQSRRLAGRMKEIEDIFKAATLNSICFVMLASLFSIRMININFMACFWFVSGVLLTASRIILRMVAAQLRSRGRDLRYMLILGTNPRAIEFANRIVAKGSYGYRLLGFADNEWLGIKAIEKTAFRVVADFDGLSDFLRRNVVDEVAIFLPVASFYAHSTQIVNLCQQHGITMRFNPDIFGVKSLRWRAEDFDGEQYLATYTGAGELWPRTMKRAIDVAVAALALLLLSPLLLMAAIAIKLTSRGPVLFLQERIGLNKRRFKIFKFRTMVPNAEKLIGDLEKQNEMAGPVFKIRHDPRITPIGRFLRKTSIDELPQLLNVLKGEMSLVGPRPLPIRDFDGFHEDWQRRRFSTKPGITCLWQIKGRNTISFDQWMRLDLQYLDEWSLWLDLKILLQTVPAVLRGSGAA